MKYVEILFYYLFPTTHLKGTPWERSWYELERIDFVRGVRLFFGITLVGYILHYYTVDVAEGLAPSELWFNYRYGMAFLSAVGLIFYSLPNLYAKFNSYRFPAILIMTVFCFFQAKSCVWYPKVPYLYTFAFMIASVTMLKTSPLKSFIVGSIISIVSAKNLSDSGVSSAMIFSGSFFSLAVVIFSRSKYIFDVKFFLITQKSLDQQKQIIEMNMEFTNQIKAFLPKEISRRLLDCIQKNRMGIGHAIHQILMPQKKKITCIFSDIRGFTKNVNDLNGFVAESMFPEVVSCTKAIEDRRGIPRKIGDLLLAYFDLDDYNASLDAVVDSAIEISRINTNFNKNLSNELKVKRFILVGTGEAIVGNLSSYSSSIEITAIGKSINLLSRVDELTKRPELQGILQSGDIIFCSDMLNYFQKSKSEFEMIRVSLLDLGLEIRDFEDIKHIHVFRLSKHVEKINYGVAA